MRYLPAASGFRPPNPSQNKLFQGAKVLNRLNIARLTATPFCHLLSAERRAVGRLVDEVPTETAERTAKMLLVYTDCTKKYRKHVI